MQTPSLFRRLAVSAAVCVVALGATLGAAPARAEFPERPVTMVVPFAAGSAADANVRILADKLRASLGVAVVVENRPGANGLVGTRAVTSAAPDGYTLLYHSTSVVINPWLVKDSPDPLKTLVPLGQVASTPYVIAVRAGLGVRTLAEFVAQAKARPGGLACSTYGVGSPPHIAIEMLRQSSAAEVLHVPYKGGFAQALVDLTSGQLQCAVDLPANVMTHARAGTLVPLATTAPSNLPSVAGVPSVTAQYPQAAVVGWSGLFVTAGSPPAAIARLEAALRSAMADPAVVGSLERVGMSPVSGTRAEFTRMVEADFARFGELIRSRNIQLQ